MISAAVSGLPHSLHCLHHQHEMPIVAHRRVTSRMHSQESLHFSLKSLVAIQWKEDSPAVKSAFLEFPWSSAGETQLNMLFNYMARTPGSTCQTECARIRRIKVKKLKASITLKSLCMAQTAGATSWRSCEMLRLKKDNRTKMTLKSNSGKKKKSDE